MEFNLEYNAIVLKNKNLFYFSNYCIDLNEFRDWLDINQITIEQYEGLNTDLKNVYLNKKNNELIKEFNNIRKIMTDLVDNNDDDTLFERINNILYFFTFYKENEYYIDIISKKSKAIRRIKRYFETNKEEIKQMITDYVLFAE